MGLILKQITGVANGGDGTDMTHCHPYGTSPAQAPSKSTEAMQGFLLISMGHVQESLSQANLHFLNQAEDKRYFQMCLLITHSMFQAISNLRTSERL